MTMAIIEFAGKRAINSGINSTSNVAAAFKAAMSSKVFSNLSGVGRAIPPRARIRSSIGNERGTAQQSHSFYAAQ